MAPEPEARSAMREAYRAIPARAPPSRRSIEEGFQATLVRMVREGLRTGAAMPD